jgi:hypothetical protein
MSAQDEEALPMPGPLALARDFIEDHAAALADATERTGSATAPGRLHRLRADLRRRTLSDGQIINEVACLHALIERQGAEIAKGPDHAAGTAKPVQTTAALDMPNVRLLALAGALKALLRDLRLAAALRSADGRAPTLVVRSGRRRAGRPCRITDVREVVASGWTGHAARCAHALAAAEILFGGGGQEAASVDANEGQVAGSEAVAEAVPQDAGDLRSCLEVALADDQVGAGRLGGERVPPRLGRNGIGVAHDLDRERSRDRCGSAAESIEARHAAVLARAGKRDGSEGLTRASRGAGRLGRSHRPDEDRHRRHPGRHVHRHNRTKR